MLRKVFLNEDDVVLSIATLGDRTVAVEHKGSVKSVFVTDDNIVIKPGYLHSFIPMPPPKLITSAVIDPVTNLVVTPVVLEPAVLDENVVYDTHIFSSLDTTTTI